MSNKRPRDDEECMESKLKRSSCFIRDLDGSVDTVVFPYATPEYAGDVTMETWLSIENARISGDNTVGALTPRDLYVVLLKAEGLFVIASECVVWPVFYDVNTQRPRTDYVFFADRPSNNNDVCSGTLDDMAANFSVTMSKVQESVAKAVEDATE